MKLDLLISAKCFARNEQTGRTRGSGRTEKNSNQLCFNIHFIDNIYPNCVLPVPIEFCTLQNEPSILFFPGHFEVFFIVAQENHRDTTLYPTFSSELVVDNEISLTTPELFAPFDEFEDNIIKDNYVYTIIPLVKRPIPLKITVAESGEV